MNQHEQHDAGQEGGEQEAAKVTRCRQCGRPLSDPISVEAEMGPVCRGRVASGAGARNDPDVAATERLLAPVMAEAGYVLLRREKREPWTNVPRLVEHHSPDGFEWGYGGSGPSDLALNILEGLVRAGRYKDVYPEDSGRTWDDGRVSGLAWRLHHNFKWAFLANLPAEGGRIGLTKIDRFVGSAEAAALVQAGNA